MRLRLTEDEAAFVRTLRAELGSVDGEPRDRLAALGVYTVEVPDDEGGLGLGIEYGVLLCAELGRAAIEDDYRATMALRELGHAATEPGWESTLRAERIDASDQVVTAIWLRQAAYLLGLGAGAHRLAVARSRTRRQFGTAIGERQSVSFPLAQAFAHLHAVRLLVHKAAWQHDNGEPALLGATRALAYAAEVALDTTATAVHVHGAFGLTRVAPVHRYYELAATEAVRFGSPAALWRLASELAAAPRTAAPRTKVSP